MSKLLGQRIGHFKVVDLLGRGGMGEVYVGYDETLERKVALKTIRADRRLDSIAKARFLREARILSQLNHPNICQIFDYIEGDDADVLVLELVRGRTLSKSDGAFPFRQKIQLALQLARVLVAAHEKGIVHRDLKPDNVMLDDTGQVKVLDFGLSRSRVDDSTFVLEGSEAGTPSPASSGADTPSAADSGADTLSLADSGADTLSHDGTEEVGIPDSRGKHPRLTTNGAVMGTLGDMSPEQARGESATPASDIYSLGLVLQELFTGHVPFDKSASRHDLIHRTANGESLSPVGMDPEVAALITRMKLLAPASRPSAVDVVDRLLWIDEKPARQRNRALVVAAFLATALFGLAMAVQFIRARTAEGKALAAKARAEESARESAAAQEASDAALSFLVRTLQVADPTVTQSRDVTVRELLDSASTRLQAGELREAPALTRVRVMNTLSNIYVNLGAYEEAQHLIEASIGISPGATDLSSISAMTNLARVFWQKGEHQKAEKILKDNVRTLGTCCRKSTSYVLAASGLGIVYNEQGRNEEARKLHEEALEIGRELYGPASPDVANSMNNLANVLYELGQGDEAEKLYKECLTIRTKHFGPEHSSLLSSLANLGSIDLNQRRYAEAEENLSRAWKILERVYPPGHPATADVLLSLGELYTETGRFADAEKRLRQGVEIQERVAPNHPNTGFALSSYARLLSQTGRLKEAGDTYKRALNLLEPLLPPDYWPLLDVYYLHGANYSKQGSRAEALRCLRRAATDLRIKHDVRADYSALQGDQEFEQLAADIEARQQARAQGR